MAFSIMLVPIADFVVSDEGRTDRDDVVHRQPLARIADAAFGNAIGFEGMMLVFRQSTPFA